VPTRERRPRRGCPWAGKVHGALASRMTSGASIGRGPGTGAVNSFPGNASIRPSC
jgi:hypothetical protein